MDLFGVAWHGMAWASRYRTQPIVRHGDVSVVGTQQLLTQSVHSTLSRMVGMGVRVTIFIYRLHEWMDVWSMVNGQWLHALCVAFHWGRGGAGWVAVCA